jgi:hypothetical protein
MKPVYDPERALWVPGRRSFLFLGFGAGVAAALGLPRAKYAVLAEHADTHLYTVSEYGRFYRHGDVAPLTEHGDFPLVRDLTRTTYPTLNGRVTAGVPITEEMVLRACPWIPR